MEKQRREKALVVVVLLVVIAGLTVAFAALSTTLNINGTAYLDAAKWGIRFENLSKPISVGKATTTGTAKIEEIKSAEITGINVSLSTPGDKVTYTVDLVNKGTINAKIDNIEKTVLTSEQQRYLTFKVTDKNGKEISQDDILSAGETKNLTITIEFIKDLTNEDLPTSTSTISLSYKLNFVQTDEKKDTTSNEVQNELPSGYKRVEYLESTGIQYIDSEVVTNINTGAKVKFSMSNDNFTPDSYIIGSLAPNRFYIGGIVDNGWTYGFMDTATGRSIISIDKFPYTKNKIYVASLNYYNNHKATIENHEINIHFSSKNGANKILLFRNFKPVNGRIYSCIITDDNSEIRNLIPCLDSDNKPCMYDTVSKKTFYNNGTGEFLYGNVID